MQAQHRIFKAICKAALVSFRVYKESIPACTWYLPVFQSLNAEKSKTKKRNHDTEPADFVKLFLNTYSAKPAQEGSKTRSAHSAGCSPFPRTPKRLRTTPQAAGHDFGFPHGLMKVGQPTTPGPGLGLQGASSTKALPKGQEDTGSGRRSRHSRVSSSRPCLEGGRGLEPLDPRSGKPDARPGTDASSRAIFTSQWMRCRSRSRSWNWSCSPLPARCSPRGWRIRAALGPRTRFRHHSHTTRFSAHAISQSEFPSRSQGKIHQIAEHRKA